MSERQFVVITEGGGLSTVQVAGGSIESDEQGGGSTFSRTVVKAFGVSIISQQRQAVPGPRYQTCLQRVVTCFPSVLCVRYRTPLDVRAAQLDIALSWGWIVDGDKLRQPMGVVTHIAHIERKRGRYFSLD